MLSAPELLQILKVSPKAGAQEREFSVLDQIAEHYLSTSLHGEKDRAEDSAQTEESADGLSLDQKLKQIDNEYMNSRMSERLLPFRELEERMVKYKREVDARMRADLAAEIARIREIEMSSVRLEEASKYRVKMQEYRNELEQVHQEKISRLKQREAEITERCKLKEREVENASFEHRQKVLQDMELLQIKEQEIKKNLEVQLKAVEMEKTSILRMKEDLETKLKDIDRLKAKVDERIHEDVEA